MSTSQSTSQAIVAWAEHTKLDLTARHRTRGRAWTNEMDLRQWLDAATHTAHELRTKGANAIIDRNEAVQPIADEDSSQQAGARQLVKVAVHGRPIAPQHA